MGKEWNGNRMEMEMELNGIQQKNWDVKYKYRLNQSICFELWIWKNLSVNVQFCFDNLFASLFS